MNRAFGSDVVEIADGWCGISLDLANVDVSEVVFQAAG
jgi:hypothetical protein